jgi:flagellar biosynthesis protein FlhG
MLPSPSRGVIAMHPGAPPQRPSAVLVSSGKGGVGTSMVAALAAIAASERGEKVLLVDATELGGSLHHLFGVRPTKSIWMLSDSRTHPDETLIDVGDNLTLVAGGTSGLGGNAVSPVNDHERRSALTRLAHVYSRFQLVIFDGGSRLDTVTAIAELMDPALLLVTSADRLALAANYAMVKSLSARRPQAIVSVLANRHGEAAAEEACNFLVGACTHFLGRAIDIAGVVPDDPSLQAGVGAGMTVRDASDGSPAANAVRAVITRFVPSWPSAPERSAAAAMSSTSPSSRRWS